MKKKKEKKINMVRSLTIKVNKIKLAKDLGVSRSSLYYQRKREEIGNELKRQIEAVMLCQVSNSLDSYPQYL